MLSVFICCVWSGLEFAFSKCLASCEADAIAYFSKAHPDKGFELYVPGKYVKEFDAKGNCLNTVIGGSIYIPGNVPDCA